MRYLLLLVMMCLSVEATPPNLLRELGARRRAMHPWTPADLGDDLALWLDAADSSTITLDGANVTQWNDKSVNNRHATSPGATKPTYELTQLNSKAIVRFGGLSYMEHSLFNLNAAFTYYVLWKRTETASNSIILSSSGGNYAYLQYGDRWYIDNRFITLAQPVGVWTTKCGMLNPTNGLRWTDGTQNESTLGYNAGNAYNFRYLGLTNGGLRGDVAEIIISAGNHSEETRQKVEGYLAHKWGLTANLPSDHPYKNKAPRKGE